VADLASDVKYPYRYDTEGKYGFCVPIFGEGESGAVSALSDGAIKTFKKLFNETIMNDKMTSYVADIAAAWKVVAICSGTAILLGYTYLILIRCMGAVIVWFSIVLI
jgi:hypothetical protein